MCGVAERCANKSKMSASSQCVYYCSKSCLKGEKPQNSLGCKKSDESRHESKCKTGIYNTTLSPIRTKSVVQLIGENR